MRASFVLVGIAGYIARRHLESIVAVGGEVVAVLDPHDSVGFLDAFYPRARFFSRESDLQSYLLEDERQRPSYLVVCSPTHLHSRHIKLGLATGCHVICEKPLVRTKAELEELAATLRTDDARLSTILQLRRHSAVAELKRELERRPERSQSKVQLQYLTPRGEWYRSSWKGRSALSGGLALNIGVHLFDLLLWLFGEPKEYQLDVVSPDHLEGTLFLEKAQVNWLLSTSAGNTVADPVSMTPHRVLTVDGQKIDFSYTAGLHVIEYESILQGRGYGLSDAIPGLALAFDVAGRSQPGRYTPASTEEVCGR